MSRAVLMQASLQMELALFTRASVFILSSVDAAVMAGGRVSCSLTLLSIGANSACPWCSAALAFCDRIWICTDFLDRFQQEMEETFININETKNKNIQLNIIFLAIVLPSSVKCIS